MKQFLLATFIFAFFFGFRVPDEDLPDVFLNVIVGPFETLSKCEDYQGAITFLLGEDVEMTDCEEKEQRV